ncbi:hypothetical protein [Streptomyces angustmyceticus]|uniref:hypothetical protein n=1 Tax=Streptomyces angustmyceticus TaxID=285578 RepID=UPI00344FA885
MTLTVEDAIHEAMETWRRLGLEPDTTDEMAEELAADLTAAAFDGRSVTDYIGGDIDALATSWAIERGLLPTPPVPQGDRPRGGQGRGPTRRGRRRPLAGGHTRRPPRPQQ